MKPADYPIPARMKHLKLDARGYPIFYITYVDKEGKPHFIVNHTSLRINCLIKDLCSICGKKLFRGRWFIGGPMSAFHPNGVYNDPPMHYECAHYALNVCPWLAAPNYAKSIAEPSMKEIRLKGGIALLDETQIPGRPVVFVAVMAVAQDYTRGTVAPYIKPRAPYRKIEFWQHGKQLTLEEGKARTLEFLNAEENKEQYGGIDTEILRRTPSDH